MPPTPTDEAAREREPAEIESVCDVSPMQLAMILDQQVRAEPGTYVLQTAVDLEGDVDTARLTTALGLVPRRHDALRSTFIVEGVSQPVRVIWDRIDVPVDLLDWRALHVDSEWEALLRRDRLDAFELEAGPLLRVFLIRTGDQAFRVLLSGHHTILDGWSLMAILQEIFLFYYREGPDLQEHPLQYSEFVQWLRTRPDETRFWKDYLGGFTPMRFPLPEEPESAPNEVVLVLEEPLTQLLFEQARKRGVTRGTLMHGAWSLLLRSYAGTNDLTFGTVVSGRFCDLHGIRDVVGPVIHTLPVRVRVQPESMVLDWLAGIHRDVMELSQKSASMQEIGGALGVPPSSLFEAVLVFENMASDEWLQTASLALEGLDITGIRHAEGPTFPVELVVFPGRRLEMRFRWRHGVLSRPLARRILANFQAQLERILTVAPDARVHEVETLAESELVDVVDRWAKGEAIASPQQPLDLVRSHEAARPAIITGGYQVSYGQLVERAHAVAHGLRRQGVSTEDRVLLVGSDLVEQAIVSLAAWEVGAAVGFVGADVSRDIVKDIVQLDHGTTVVESQAELSSRAELTIDRLVALGESGAEVAAAGTHRRNAAIFVPVLGDDLQLRLLDCACGWLASRAQAPPLDDCEGESLLLVGDLGGGRPALLLSALCAGATVWDASELDAQDPSAVLSRARSSGCTRAFSVSDRDRLESHRALSANGVALHLLAFDDWGGEGLEHASVRWAGLPEVGGPALSQSAPSGSALGRPVTGARCFVVDQWSRPVPACAEGEVVLGGSGLSRGYVGSPVETADRFRPDPLSQDPGARVFHTRRRAKWRLDGRLESRESRPGDPRAPRSRHLELVPWLSMKRQRALAARTRMEPSSRVLRRSSALRQAVGAAVPGGGDGPPLVDFWRRRLADVGSRLELSAKRTGSGSLVDAERVSIPGDVRQAASKLARRLRVPVATVYASAWAVILARYGAADVVVVAIEIAASNLPKILPVPLPVRAARSFEDLVAEMALRLFEGLAHCPATPSDLRGLLQLAFPEGSAPLSQTLFGFEPEDAVADPLFGRRGEGPPRSVEFVLRVIERSVDAEVVVSHDEAGVDAERAAGMARAYVHVLGAGVLHPTRELFALPLLDERASADCISKDVAGYRELPVSSCLHERFAAMAEACPDRVAVTDDEGGVTYGDLARASDRVAAHLRSVGVGPESRVGIHTERNTRLIVAILGVLKAGACYVPLDPIYPRQRLDYMVADSGMQVVLYDGVRPFATLGVRWVSVTEAIQADWAAPVRSVLPHNLAYIIYTSGSTGRPKGVEVTHANAVRLFASTEEWFGFTPEDVWTLFHSYAFDFTVWELWGALLYGGRLVVVPGDVSRDAEAFHRLLVSEGVTFLSQTPSAFYPLMEANLRASDASALKLREIVFGGEALNLRRLQRWFDRHGDDSPRLVNMYGITETTVHVTYRPLTAADGDQSASLIGRPIPDLHLHTLDEALAPVPLGALGEIFVGGAGVSRGYTNRPRQTAERMLPDPFAGVGARLYRSGDLGRRTMAGDVEYLRRIDHQIQLRGFRVELGEVEAVLEEVSGAARVVVIVDGAGDAARLLAYLVVPPGLGHLPNEDALRERLVERLPAYMVPSVLVTIRELPLTENGKVDRHALPKPNELVPEQEPPRTPTEAVLAEIWRELLQRQRVARSDDFLRIGGHSLLATRLVARLRAQLGVEVSIGDVFEHPVLSDLAAVVDVVVAGAATTLPPIVPVPRQATMLSSFAQERLWFLDQLSPNSTAYHMPATLGLRGVLDEEAFSGALADLIERHEILRTGLRMEEDIPVQVIESSVPLPLRIEDLRDRPDGPAIARRVARDQMRRPFDLAQAPLVRLTLLRLSDEEWSLVFVMHHVISDGWSLSVLLRDLQELYVARLAGTDARSPAPPIHYADYASWQRRWLQGEELRRQLTYWRGRLAGAAPVLDLALDRPRQKMKAGLGGTLAVELGADLTAGVERLGTELGATPFMVLLATWQLLLSRHARTRDVIVGSPIAGRRLAELEPLIGFFVNTLVLRTDFSGDPTFAELVARVKDVTLSAYAHQDVPFEKLVSELKVERDTSVTPLFQVMFSYQDDLDERLGDALSWPDLQMWRRPEQALPEAKFELTLSLSPSGVGALTYDTTLFDRATAQRLTEQLVLLVEEACRRPDLPVSSLRLRGGEWLFGRAVEERRGDLVSTMASAWEGRFGEPALRCGNEHWSFGTLWAASSRVARALRDVGVGPEARVAIRGSRTLETVASLIGVWRAGAAYVVVDPEWPTWRQEYVLSTCDAFVGDPDSAGRLHVPYPEPLSAELKEDLPIDGAMLGYVLFTSGSTGTPKGVEVSRGSLLNYLRWSIHAYELSPGTWTPVQGSLAFDATATALWAPLFAGAGVVLLRGESALDALAELLGSSESRFAMLKGTPGLMTGLGRTAPGEASTWASRWVVGGETLSGSAVDEWWVRSPSTPIHNQYGPTETTVACAAHLVQRGDRVRARVPVGNPIDGTHIAAVDRLGRPAGILEPGELWVGGAGVARGYAQRPRETAAVFRPDPSGAVGERVYCTGDVGRVHEAGHIEFLGRRDRQVKLRGYRVELGEVESVLAAVPRVVRAAADVRGTGDRARLVAWVATDTETDLEPALRQAAEGRLPAYMVPSAFVQLKALPLTTNGKVDRHALPDPERSSGADYEPPATAAEAVLAEIWQELLGVPRVGRQDDFFALGGHSLLATQLISRIRARLDVELGVREVFEHPELAALAARAEEGAAATLAPLTRADRMGLLRVSFAQERMWVLQQLLPESMELTHPTVFRLEGALSIDALRNAVEQILVRHEVLRTCYRSTTEGLSAHIVPMAELGTVVEVCDAAEEDSRREDVVQRVFETPFDLQRDIPFRCAVVRYGERRHELLACMHHIAGDGWTSALLIRELAESYRAVVEGSPLPLPEALQYADFAQWQRQHVEPLVGPQIDYWRAQLDGAARLELPTDRSRPAIQSKRGARIERVLGAATVERVRALARDHRTTTFAVLLAALKAVLGRVAGADDVVVGMPINGRRNVETETMFGCFLNTLVLRTSLAGNPTFEELVDRVAATSLEAQSHQDAPFERLLEELKPPRDMSRTPWFQVFFNYMETLPRGQIETAGLSMTREHALSELANFDLTVYVLSEPAGGLRLSALYCRDLFDESTVAEWLDAMARLLARALEEPQLRVAALTDAPDAAPSSAIELPAPDLVTDRFERAAAAYPDAVAVVYGDRALTYGALHEGVLAAGKLIAEAPRASGRVGLVFRKGPEMVVGVMAALYAGRCYVALDASYPPDRLSYMVEHAECDVLVCAPDTRALADDLAGRRPVAVVGAGQGALEGPVSVPPSAEAYVLYTSGSTGVPKGVVQTKLNLSNYVDIYAQRAGIGPGDRLSLISSFSFDAAISDIFGALVSGAAVCPFDVKEQGFATLPDFLRSNRVSIYHSTPTVFRALLDTVEAGAALPDLRVVVLGGEPVLRSDVERFRAAAPASSRIVNNLGASECSISLWADFTEDVRLYGRLPMGAPVARTRALLIDDTGAESFVGQLVIQSPHLARGYLKADDQTATVFKSVDGRRSYVSGDYAYRRPDGMFVSLGRRDRQVKVRGNRIELGEVETAARAHESVSQAAAMVVRREGAGESAEGLLCAFVEAPAGSRKVVRAHLQSTLPGYMVPSQIFVVDEIPMTPSGKVDYLALEGLRASSTKEPSRPPQTDLEKAIAAALIEAIPGTSDVGLEDHFFDDLGGTSLALVRAAQYLSSSVGQEVRSILFFEYPTIAALSEALMSASTRKEAEGPTLGERSDRRRRALRSRRGKKKS